MNEEDYEQELLEEMQSQQEDDASETQAEQMMNQQEFQEGYGAPEPEEKQNQFQFLNKAVFDSPDYTRTTFLTESELGRPLFNVRFLLDMHDISKYYLDSMIKAMGGEPNKDNKIAGYFWEKIQNITGSGMSNKGFAMNLSVTKKMDTVRRRVRDLNKPMEGKK